jgi:hypothetical protein
MKKHENIQNNKINYFNSRNGSRNFIYITSSDDKSASIVGAEINC